MLLMDNPLGRQQHGYSPHVLYTGRCGVRADRIFGGHIKGFLCVDKNQIEGICSYPLTRRRSSVTVS
jgi:hypothetical protein